MGEVAVSLNPSQSKWKKNAVVYMPVPDARRALMQDRRCRVNKQKENRKMKRAAYWGLAQVPIPMWGYSPQTLCAFCRYAKWDGMCNERECECCHPLGRALEYASIDVYESCSDCWGFRPDVSVDTATEMVSAWLRGKHVYVPNELLLPKKVR